MRVAILTNFIAPYRVPLLQDLQSRFESQCVFASTKMEPNRPWSVDWGDLNVIVQKNITIRRNWAHPKGFTDTLYVQVPYDTIPQLYRYQPDVIVSVEFGMRTVQAALYCLISRIIRKKRPKLIVWAQISESTEQARGKLRYLLRKTLTRFMDAVFVNGHSGKRYLQNNFGVAQDKFFFSPYTTDVADFAQAPVQRHGDQAQRLLYVGQFIERKGLEPFLKILIDWCRKNDSQRYELWMAGTGPLLERVENIDWPDNLDVTMLGNVDYEKLPELYAQVGIMVFPTLADEWGVVTVEAMAAGVPVLGSIYAQSVEEMIDEGENGWIFAPDNAQQTMAALDQALNTGETRLNVMREIARQKALALTPEKVAEMMTHAIKQVASD